MPARVGVITGSVALATLAILGLWLTHQEPAPEVYLPVFAADVLLVHVSIGGLATRDNHADQPRTMPQWRRIAGRIAAVLVFALAGLTLIITCIPHNV